MLRALLGAPVAVQRVARMWRRTWQAGARSAATQAPPPPHTVQPELLTLSNVPLTQLLACVRNPTSLSSSSLSAIAFSWWVCDYQLVEFAR